MRRSAGCDLDGAICVYDLAQRLGIEVRILDIPSMEGMYYRASEPTIILSSLRPPGRRAFTCAHELGHHSRGDGTRIDQLVEQWQRPKFDPGEFAADCFAGALLMPKMAVERAFALREWKMSESTPEQAYTVSNYFGVGYTTLIHHMRSALLLLPDARAEALLKIRPRQAQALALGWETPETVWVVDGHWSDRAIDVEAGDLIFVDGQPNSEGDCVEHVLDTERGRLLRARQPGIGRLENGSTWSAFVRVSRRGFIGRSLFRHREEPDDE
jgi:Zn-dependent peptidase ImmA (M78 family)